jgi:anti-sigma B factor antagonist
LGSMRHRNGGGFYCDIELDGRHARLQPVGELDLATAGDVHELLEQLSADGPRDLVVDLRGLTFMDSTGIALLLRWQQRAAADGIRFGVVLGDERVRRPLELTGVLGHLDVRDA